MILTALSHALVAILISLIGLFTGNLLVGIGVALGFYLGREVAQHERKTQGSSFRGLFFWEWSTDAKLDLLFPVIACFILYMVNYGFFH